MSTKNYLGKIDQEPLSALNSFPAWIRNIFAAAIITLLIHLSFGYIVYGSIFREFNIADYIEITFTFFYFLALFWIYPKLSLLIQSNIISGLKPAYVKIIEGVSVTLVTLLLNSVVKFLPMWLVLIIANMIRENSKMRFDTDNIRRSFIIHVVIGLFFYYFVERERIKKQLQEEHLHYARLQKEKFRVQLENLKSQVNPGFLFDSLNFLENFVQEDPDRAEEFVNRLSQVYRSFLDRREQLVPLKKEFELIENYIFILKCRFGSHLNFNYHLSPGSVDYLLPPGSLQELIERIVINKEPNSKHPLSISILAEEKELLLKCRTETGENLKLPDGVLLNITGRYKFFTDQKIETATNGEEFTVKLPLLSIDSLPEGS